jgi:organic hydroperoxide reductase OsmC/OhrA
MSEHRASVRWQGGAAGTGAPDISRDHELSTRAGRVRLRGSAAPAYGGSDAALDPEDAVVAALSACHMLTFLAIAAKRRLVVLAYADDAVGELGPGPDGRTALTRVTLRPVVTFAAGGAPAAEAFAKLHAKAHEHCFIANSVRSEVRIEPRLAGD